MFIIIDCYYIWYCNNVVVAHLFSQPLVSSTLDIEQTTYFMTCNFLDDVDPNRFGGKSAKDKLDSKLAINEHIDMGMLCTFLC